MSQFIFPVIIESRKILFLDLEPQGEYSEIKNVGEDVYIVKLPDAHERMMLAISRSRLIQSLDKDIEDIPLKDVSFSFQYNPEIPCLTITAHKQAPVKANQTLELFKGLFIKIENDDSAIELKLSKTHQFESLKQDHVYIQFVLDLDHGDFLYAASIKLYLADKKDILYAGFDFGSEASQMCEGDYRDSGNELRQKTVNLFADIKNRMGGKHDDEAYLQYENRKLYKSIFYAKKSFSDNNYDPSNRNSGWLLPSGSINGLTISDDIGNGNVFFENWVQIPNLKIIYDNASVGSSISFDITSKGQSYSVDLINIRLSLYASLLKEILISYLSKRIFSDVYLGFTLLVPNIYSIGEIKETKKIIRSIVLDAGNPFHEHIKGLEISSLSESDAAFLGCMSALPVEDGSYYIIIDCGKGTTDFSIIQFEGKDTFKSIYRNGFAGAGNLISFAVLQSVLYYLKETQKDKPTAGNFEKFKKDYLSKGPLNRTKYELSGLAEKWKKSYNSNLTQEQIENEWSKAKSEDLNFASLFQRQREPSELFSFLSKIDHVYDWGGYIGAAIDNIIGKIEADLAPIVSHLKSPCGGILLTGRGFLFTPLQEATKTIIRSIKGMEKVKFINTMDKNLKEICLEGVFVRNILSYNDIASTPIEIKKGSLRQFTQSDVKASGFLTKIKRALNKLADLEGEYYDEDSNTCKVLNTDFAECQFLVGNKKYQPEHLVKDITEAALIQSRKGLFIKATTASGKKIVPLVNIVRRETGDQLMVEKSLFPGWYDPHLLES